MLRAFTNSLLKLKSSALQTPPTTGQVAAVAKQLTDSDKPKESSPTESREPVPPPPTPSAYKPLDEPTPPVAAASAPVPSSAVPEQQISEPSPSVPEQQTSEPALKPWQIQAPLARVPLLPTLPILYNANEPEPETLRNIPKMPVVAPVEVIKHLPIREITRILQPISRAPEPVRMIGADPAAKPEPVRIIGADLAAKPESKMTRAERKAAAKAAKEEQKRIAANEYREAKAKKKEEDDLRKRKMAAEAEEAKKAEELQKTEELKKTEEPKKAEEVKKTEDPKTTKADKPAVKIPEPTYTKLALSKIDGDVKLAQSLFTLESKIFDNMKESFNQRLKAQEAKCHAQEEVIRQLNIAKSVLADIDKWKVGVIESNRKL